MLKLKLQYFGLMWRASSLEKALMLEEKGATEDEMWLNGTTKSEQTQGGSNGQGSLVSCSPWGHKELDTT